MTVEIGKDSCFNADKAIAYHECLEFFSFELTEIMPVFSSFSHWQTIFYLRVFSRVQVGTNQRRCLPRDLGLKTWEVRRHT